MTISRVILFLVPLLVFLVALVIILTTPKGTATRRFAIGVAVRVSCFLLGMGGGYAMLEAKFTHWFAATYWFPAIVGVYVGTTLIVSWLPKKASSIRERLRKPMNYTLCGVMGFCALALLGLTQTPSE